MNRKRRLGLRAGYLLAVLAAGVGANGVRAAGKPEATVAGPKEGVVVQAGGVVTANVAGGERSDVVPAGCSTCGDGLLSPGPQTGPGVYGYGHKPWYATCGDLGSGCEGCGEAGCVPGREPCVTAPVGCGRGSKLFAALHNCLCCPDPCYEPKWVPTANAALFVDPVRPVTQTRLRWDAGRNLQTPNRGEYFWGAPPKGPGAPETGVNYDTLSLYTEAATDRFSLFFDMPYRNLDPNVNPGAAGFGDLILGTKTLLVDCELIQLAFQFSTYLPTGNFGKGIGTGHTSLEPALLASIKLYPETYFQGQLAQWIPLGGTPGFQGGVLHYHTALNHTLWKPLPDTLLIGTLEFNGWSFQSGGYTSPINGVTVPANGTTYASIGPGLRWSVCNKVDIGFGMAFAVTDPHWANQLYRTEMRWRY